MQNNIINRIVDTNWSVAKGFVHWLRHAQMCACTTPYVEGSLERTTKIDSRDKVYCLLRIKAMG